MKEYEIVYTYLNGCAGSAYPIRAFEEVEIVSPEEYLREKHGTDFEKFTKEVQDDGRILFTYTETVTHIYEFTEL